MAAAEVPASSIITCSNTLDCPIRFKCYPSSDQSAQGGECHCNRALMYSGEDCLSQGFPLFTFLMTLYIMARCTHHSYHVFRMHVLKWNRERLSHKKLGSLPLPLLASFWVFVASSFCTVCLVLNTARMFTRVTAAYERFIQAQVMPFCWGMSALMTNLSASVTGLFWAEIAISQRKNTTSSGRWVPSSRLYRLYCLVFSATYATVFVAINLFFGGNSTSTFLLLVVSFVVVVMVYSAGARLIHLELAKLQINGTDNDLRGLGRVIGVFRNARVAALKILTNGVMVVLSLSLFTVCEAKPFETFPSAGIHFMSILCYACVSLTLIAIGQYLAAEKVTFLPLWLLASVYTWPSMMNNKQKRRVVPGGGDQEPKDSHHDEHPAIEHTTTSKGHNAVVRKFFGFPSSDLRNMDIHLLPPISKINTKREGAGQNYFSEGDEVDSHQQKATLRKTEAKEESVSVPTKN